MPTPPPRRAWGTRFDSLVDSTATPPDVRPPRDADPDLPAEKERPADHGTPAYPRSSLPAATPTANPSLLPLKMPHDASVFVASLPSHIPESELQARLSAHLSPHATIKHIKLIRDNRGAVCAFVQVESAAQAADLIAACNLTLFMDRHIRCEVARAFRSLLVSWRPRGHPANASTNAGDETTANALRLRRCKGSRYIQVSHGASALETDISKLHNFSLLRAEDPLSGLGILFASGIVEGDNESLKLLLEAFGPMEFINPFDPTPFQTSRSDGDIALGDSTANQQDGRKTPVSEGAQGPQIWEAKWEHRNDAVSAFTALQHVPCLFVCWSHTYGRYPQQLTPSKAHSETHPRGSPGVHPHSYPSTPFHRRTYLHADNEINNRDSETRWTVSGPRFHQLNPQASASDGKPQEPLAFSESDFPPLRADTLVGSRGSNKRGQWIGHKNFLRSGVPSPPPISTSMPSLSIAYNGSDTPTSGAQRTPDLDSVVEPSPVTPGFPITPRTPSGDCAPHDDETPKDAAAYSPTAYTPIIPRHFEDSPGDGRELFVGGLDPTTWDEERVHSVFGRFGSLEEIRFVRPGMHAPSFKRAFAFIRYADQEAPQRAIAEEHLRLYDDRRIKVQLREATGRRWGLRGRNRFHHGLLRTDRASFDFDHDVSAVGQAGHAVGGHVRFASVPDATIMKSPPQAEEGGVQSDLEDAVEDTATPPAMEGEGEADHGYAEDSGVDHTEENAVTESTPSSASDVGADASMEVQPPSADTTVTIADVKTSPRMSSGEVSQYQPEQDAASALPPTPPPSNPDGLSTYAPSSEVSVPTTTAYYPSWIPSYAIPSAPYGPYGYYQQQVPGQSGAEPPGAYPWMASLYRNVVSFLPWFNPPAGVELPTPPVRPTGYIQRDGIFIPVYPPERLGQYMSNSSGTADHSQPSQQAQGASAAPGNWQNIPVHPQFYPIPFHVQQMMIAQQHQHHHAAGGHSWVSGPIPGPGYPSQQTAPSSANAPYTVPNTYYQTQSSNVQSAPRQSVYGHYDPVMQHGPKHLNRRSEYGHHQPRYGPRGASQRRGPGAAGGDQSLGNGSIDAHSYPMKPNGVLPTQLSMTSSGSHGSDWSWNTQSR